MIAQYVGNRHREWDQHLEALQFAINTAKHATTGYSPAFLVHGRELARPHPEDRRPTEGMAPEERRQILEEAYELARIHLAQAFQKQERQYNLRRRGWRPQKGELVWKRDRTLSSKSDAISAKLAPKYDGPMEVRRIISPVIVDLKDHLGKWHRRIHVQDLKPDPGDEEEGAEGDTNTGEEETPND
ncbi:uncharacterized protein LOC118647210 [Monomorium pharaonis]|uniref:uncharacterized protein LOC118647210 n=1 Tax=Monomorium pharaonis TaxID=307658 RepID=UPI001746A603|nr:uncharacterized protein LOC118647210 [Monomorium pharaonis]